VPETRRSLRRTLVGEKFPGVALRLRRTAKSEKEVLNRKPSARRNDLISRNKEAGTGRGWDISREQTPKEAGRARRGESDPGGAVHYK